MAKYIYYPFEKNLSLLILLWILTSAADLSFWISYGNPIFGIYMATHGLLISYILTFFVGLLKGILKYTFKSIFIVLGIINIIIDTAVHCIMKCGFTKDLVAVFMGTNANETKEFLSMYINPKMILIIITLLIIATIGYYISKRHYIKSKSLKYFCLMTIIMCACIIFFRGSKNWDGVYLMKIKTTLEYQPTPDLREYRKTYEIESSEKPKNVILIIGESLNKEHMSLYGYKKTTTPVLDSLNNNKELFVFNNVKSSAIGTVPAFRYMMSSLRVSDNVEKWLEKDFLLDIIKSAGYNTMWISNQSSSGVHDNIVARFAELSDSVIWCGTKYTGPSKTDLDEIVLEPSKFRAQESLSNPKFTIIHLAGNHENFKSRYSKKFELFKEKDYLDYLENQRITLSQYDNSVIYNDWVVGELIKTYKDQEAIIIYLSDHSLDIYNSSDDYAGHARPTEPKSVEAGINIPFIIYASSSYKLKYHQIIESIKNSTEKLYYTENIMYTILDLMNIQLTNNMDIKKYSLLNTK